MFENVGEKIKTVVKVFCWIKIVACVIGGLILLFGAASVVERLIGLALIFLGPLVSWLGSLAMYGFGEMVEKITALYYSSGLR